jgi:hypothetical protein
MTRIESMEDFERARERLRRRNSDSLVAFLVSLAVDSGPVGEHLLVAIFEADQVAMENCGEHDWEVACAYERAVGVMAEAAKHLPRAEIEERVKRLIEGDAYGVRAGLVSVYCIEAQAR